MIKCIDLNDLKCLKSIMENDDTYLTEKICTKLLVECLKQKRIAIANYIMNYDFDLDADIFESYIESKKSFTEKELINLNKIFNKKFICCLVNT